MNSTTLSQPVATPIAVRVYPESPSGTRLKSQIQRHRPNVMLIIDTETTVDATQQLLFGSYRVIRLDRYECVEEGLFFPDSLTSSQKAVMETYATNRRADTVRRSSLKLLPLREFLKTFYRLAYKGRCLVVGFNLPFDLARLAFDTTESRHEFDGGFSLILWSYFDCDGIERADPNRPRITIKHLDSKRSLISFTGRKDADRDDRIPDDSPDGAPQDGFRFRGHFLDLRTFTFALTEKAHTLKSACEAFKIERCKTDAKQHGTISHEYIDYNRRDVEATAALAEVLLAEYDLHPIDLQETKAFSPASIGKAYLRAMGIGPILQRQPNLVRYVGFAQTAFIGGRTSAHIRKVPVPVVYTDFVSMYPTVNSLMNLWQFVIAKKIKVIDHCAEEIVQFLENLKEKHLFKPETWKRLTAFVRLMPDGDALPVRGQYGSGSNDWQVAINHLHAGLPDDQLWFSLPDVVASVLLTGRIPKIVDAFRIEASRETMKGLKPIKFRGKILIDPARQDFFKVVIEERKRVSSRSDLDLTERERISKALKVLANSTSYGIYAEMNQTQLGKSSPVKCHGIEPEGYTCRVHNPEVPGEFCFPPLASLITGAARLMLALLENSVAWLGGTYAMEDTDSMAIVATEHGGLLPCPGGPLKMPDGSPAIQTLSWAQVGRIEKQFEALNPYDRSAVPGSILKIVDCNFDSTSRKQRQIWCLAISAKRYALFLKDDAGNPSLLRRDGNNTENRWSEHGLGHLLNPTDLLSDDREWIAKIWESLIAQALGTPIRQIQFADIPAVGKLAITSPPILAPMKELNAGKDYPARIKPFNFLLTAHINSFGHPVGSKADRFHLIAPFELDSKKWLRMTWIDQYSGNRFRITAMPHANNRHTAWVRTFRSVIAEYAHHPESKYADQHGNPSDRQTIGLLQRRHVRIAEIVPIGKESNRLEEVDAGLVHSADEVYTVYPDQKADHWERAVRPLLQKIPLSVLMRETGLSRRMLIKARRGDARPHSRNQLILVHLVTKHHR
jgi:hypothetical protein